MLSFNEHSRILTEGAQLLQEGKKTEEVKKAIMSWLRSAGAEQIDILNEIFTKINQKALKEKVDTIVANNNLYSEDGDLLLDTLSTSSVDFEEKINFLDKLAKGKGIDGKKVLNSNKKTTLMSLLPSDLAKNEVLPEVVKAFLKQESRQRGRGEAVITLLVADAQPASVGDVEINNVKVEAKGVRGRPRGQKGFKPGKGTQNREVLRAEILNHNPNSDIPKNFTFTFSPANIKTWNKGVAGIGEDNTVSIIYERSKTIYPEIDKMETKAKNILKKGIKSDGSLVDDFQHYFTAMVIDYYTMVEDHDMFMLMNANDPNLPFIIFKDGEDLINQKNVIKISAHTWEGSNDRESVPALTLK